MKVVRRARRGMRNRTILLHLPAGWTVALVCWSLVLFSKPFLPVGFGLPLWIEGGIALALGSVFAVILGLRRGPSMEDAALAIDRECGLRERVISAVSLPSELCDTPAGEALLDDARLRLSQADLHRSFGPAQQSRDFAWPLAAGLLATGAFYLGPFLQSWLASATSDNDRPIVRAEDVELELEKLRKVSAFQKNEEVPRSKELEELGAEWEKLLNKPIDPANQEQVRERAREVQDFQNKLKEAAQKMEGKRKDVEDVLAKLMANQEDGKKGLADDLAKALAKGDFAKAAQAVERLQNRNKDKKLDPAEEKQLAEQLKDLENRLRRLADPREKRDQLAKDHKDGKINDAELQRELDQLADLEKNLQELKDLAEGLKELQEQLGKGEPMEFAKAEKLLAELKKLDRGKGDLKKLDEELRRMEKAQMALCELCQGKDGKLNALGRGEQPGGRRRIAKDDPDGKIAESPDRAKVDPTGKLRVTGIGWGGGAFTKIPAKELGGVIQQAVQDAPEVIERQRIPPEAADLARGYFQKLGGQK